MKRFYAIVTVLMYVCVPLLLKGSPLVVNNEKDFILPRGPLTHLTVASEPVTNLQAVLSNPLTGQVDISWDYTPGIGFQYFRIDRNGQLLDTISSAFFYSDDLPVQSSYTYCVTAIYPGDTSAPVCTTVVWPVPGAQVSVDSLYETVWTECTVSSLFYVRNTGPGTLYFEFPDYTDLSNGFSPVYCAASANMQDETIGRVQISNLDHSSGWSGYNDFTAFTANLTKNTSMPITVTGGGNAYSSDIAGVWIDYDHNSVFDDAEFTQLATMGGGTSFTGTIIPPVTALPGPTTMRIRLQYMGLLSPCGTSSYGEVEDYTVDLINPSFIIDVVPVSGILMPGDSALVYATFSATGPAYSPLGTYHSILKLNTNDPAIPALNLPATMVVGWGCHVLGVVRTLVNNNVVPLAGVLVQGGTHYAYTNLLGEYDLTLDQGNYSLLFSRNGYETLSIPGISMVDSMFLALDTTMYSQAYPTNNVNATVNFDDTQCIVNWSPAVGPQELLYDDSEADASGSWPESGYFAVKFTPDRYPVTITGAKFHLDSGYAGNPVGTSLKAQVYLPDGNGMPGLLVDSASMIITGLGWVQLNGFNTRINSGDFFVALYQDIPWPDCPELMMDVSAPVAGRSYFRDLAGGGDWTADSSQNYMIRALMNGPGGSSHYSVYRVSGFNPIDPPATGVFTLINNACSDTSWVDSGNDWITLPSGWYAYGIRSNSYQSSSEIIFSNIVPHKLFKNLGVAVHLSCDNAPAAGAIVKLTGLMYPYDVLADTLPASGSDSLFNVIEGDYLCKISYPGYESYSDTISLYDNQGLDVVLYQSTWPPRNLFVDDQTLISTWEEPLAVLISEDFEGPVYPPDGWQTSTQGDPGWIFTDSGSGANFVIPPHTSYAVTNDGDNPASNGCCDRLITPEVDLTAAPSFVLGFMSYFTGGAGQTATVEMSTDGGASWSEIYTCPQFNYWMNIDVDLTAYSGLSGLPSVKFAFHSNDAGGQGSGWAVDNIWLVSGGLALEGYNVYLDSVKVNPSPVPDLVYFLDPALFAYGETHTECVTAVYCNGESTQDCFNFTSHYLPAPENLLVTDSVSTTEGYARLSWGQLLDAGLPVIGYKVYRDWDSLTQVPASDTTFLDQGLQPGLHIYEVSALYDISSYGFPGQTDESLRCPPDSIMIIYGLELPFNEDFSSGIFNASLWQTGENWVIENLADDTDPAAKFSSSPLLQNYSSALVSNWINTTDIDSLSPYNVWLDFDLELSDVLANGAEKLSVQVYDSLGWQVVAEFPNTGSFGWTKQHLDIGEYSRDRLFKVGFFAEGIASQSISYWALDDIAVYTETALLPPFNLTAELPDPQGTSVELSWNDPGSGMKYVMPITGWYSQGIDFPGDVLKSAASFPVSLQGYNVYRKEIGSTADTGFVLIAFTDTTAYLDENLTNYPQNCYAYQITAQYDLGESVASNADSVCLYTGIRVEKSLAMKIYPNPAIDLICVEVRGGFREGFIYDAQGRMAHRVRNAADSDRLWVDISSLPAGLYSVRLNTYRGVASGRILVVK